MRKVQNRSFLGNSLFKKMLGAFALAILVLLACPQMEAQAKTTITVKSVNQATAKKVHKQLMKGKEFDIRIPGNEQNFYSKFQKLTKKVAKCTDYGFDVFPICMETSNYFGYSGGDNPVPSGGYTIFTVKKKHCEEYIYGIKYAKRQIKDFKARVNQVIAESEKIYNGLKDGTIEVQYGHKSKKKLTSDTEKTITNLRELKKYLTKTKFRNLSEAMRARILLEFGDSYTRPWGKASMRLVEDKKQGHDYSFKLLYQRKAYGRNIYHATLACKICATFNIGDFDFSLRSIGGASHNVVRVKVKTCKNKTRYIIVDNGSIADNYNSYAGYTTFDLMVRYRKAYKDETPIKKIKKTQRLKKIELGGRLYEARSAITGSERVTYYINFPKSEW